jgi:hypothetical protein
MSAGWDSSPVFSSKGVAIVMIILMVTITIAAPIVLWVLTRARVYVMGG